MARVAVSVPDLGMQSEEIKFGAWLKDVGDEITLGEDLFEVEADKATVVCEAQAAGTLAEVSVTTGPVTMGEVIGYIDA